MRTTHRVLIVALAALLLVPASAAAHGKSKGKGQLAGHWHTSKVVATQDLLVATTKLDRVAIATGELARQQGGTDAIRALGATLVQGHTTLQQQVDALAARLGVTLPDGLDPWSQRWVDKLAQRSGDAFDRTFVTTELWVQRKALNGALWAAIRADTPEGRALAQGALPVLTSHLAALYDLAAVDDEDGGDWSGDRDDDGDHGGWRHGKRGHDDDRGHESRRGKRR